MSIRCLQERSMTCLLTELTGLKCASLVAGLQYYHIVKSYMLPELISCLADPAYRAWYGVSAKP
jgi:hypothetical protein